MPELIWDKVGERLYETGLDRGVLYLPDGSGVPWNGLTSVIEKFDKTSSPVYYDGMKIGDLVVLGDFEASLKAITYPDEFIELEGLGLVPGKQGLFYSDQPPKSFGLCYRTQVGNDLEGDIVSHKIHLLYNVTAIPRDRTHETLSSDPILSEFEWSIAAVPEEVPGFRPTAHVIIDSRNVDPWLLEELEEMLYGSSKAVASLIPMADLVTYIMDWYRIKIIDNGDETWTVVSRRDESIEFDYMDEDLFTIFGANATFLDEGTYTISDTIDIKDTPNIKIVDNGDGTWHATTDDESLFSVDVENRFEILNANAIFVNEYTYQVSDSIDTN